MASANPTACDPHTLIGEAWCQDLGVPLPYQWKDRAKPLEGRVAEAAAHVGCCVLCCVVCCDLSDFSYHPGRNTISKLKMANFCTIISQNWPTNTPNITGCANLSSFRDVALVLTFWCKRCLGHAMSVQKKTLKIAKFS